MANVSPADVRDAINVSEADIPDVKLQKMVKRAEVTLEFGLGGTHKTVFTGCKWENVAIPTRVEELVSLKARFVAKTVAIS